MTELTAVLLAFPTVIFTVLLGVALVYWLFVVIGALDLDLLGPGHAEGAIEGATKGLAEGAADGLAEGAPDGLAGLFTALRLKRAPVTVVVTLFAAFGWLVSVLTMQSVGAVLMGAVPAWLLGTLVLGASSVASLVVTSVAVRPLGRLFVTHAAKGRSDLVGRVCVVSTGRVDARFGQATVEDGGAGLILPVRCDAEGALRRGERALIIGWDHEREGFLVEPLEPMERPLPPAPGRGQLVEDERKTPREPKPSQAAPRVAAPELSAESEPPSERTQKL